VIAIIQRIIATLYSIPYWLVALAARIFPAAVFWQSGQTKVAGWHLKPSAIALFQNEYQLPLVDPTTAAYLSAFGEHFFPILLVLGLATRFAAMGLLFMRPRSSRSLSIRALGRPTEFGPPAFSW
jgi:putative oxidoreductase